MRVVEKINVENPLHSLHPTYWIIIYMKQLKSFPVAVASIKVAEGVHTRETKVKSFKVSSD